MPSNVILSASDIYSLLTKDPLIGMLAKVRVVDQRLPAEAENGVFVYIKKYPSVEEFEATWNIWIVDYDGDPLDVVIAQMRKLLPRFTVVEDQTITKATTTELRTPETEVEPIPVGPESQIPTILDLDSRFNELKESIQDQMLLVGPGRPGNNGRDGRDGKDGSNGKDGKDGKDLVATEAELGDLRDVYVSDAKRRQFLMFDGSSWVPSFVPRVVKGSSGSSPEPERSEVGVIYLKNNAAPTPISSINGRSIVVGSMLTGELFGFAKDVSTNSLKYSGSGNLFHAIVSFNFSSGSQDICGFYIGRSTNAAAALDPNADRISESEIYINSASNSAQPVGGTIQTVLSLNTDDRVFFIVQNKDSTHAITVQFLKFIIRQI